MSLQETYVSVVAPIYNDAAHLEESLTGLVNVLAAHYANYEVILIDDWSSDGTAAVAAKLLERLPCLRLIRLSRRFGTDIAIAAGLDSAIGDYVVVMNLPHDPAAEIPRMVELGRSGHGVVVGLCTNRARGNLLFQLARALFFALCRTVFQLKLPPDATNFQLFSRQAVNAVIRIMQRNRHFRLVSGSIGYATATFRYAQLTARAWGNRRTVSELVGDAVSIVVLHTTSPLRILSGFCALAGVFNLVYVVYIVAVLLFKNHVAEGWTTLSLQVSGMFFLLFLALAVLAEYLGKILQETKGEPLYHVLETKDSPQSVAHPGRRNVWHAEGVERRAAG